MKVANLIGTGIRAKFDNKALQKLWKSWIKQCDAAGLLDFNGIQAQCYRAMDEAGEVFVRFRTRLPDDGLEVPLQLQVLEAEYLDSTKTGPTDNGDLSSPGCSSMRSVAASVTGFRSASRRDRTRTS